MENLEKALKPFMTGDIPVSDLAHVLSLFSHCERINYQELATVTYGSVDEVLLALWEWKLVIPVRSFKCSEWDSRIMIAEPEESYENRFSSK